MQKLICALLVILFSCCHFENIFGQNRQKENDSRPKKIIRVSENTLRRNVTGKVAPIFPELAKAGQVSGAVTVEITVDEYGNVVSARALSGHPLLIEASLVAAKRWQFNPTVIEGDAFKVIGSITLQFNSDGTTSTEKKSASEQSTGVDTPDFSYINNLEEQAANSLYRLGSAYSAAKRYREAAEVYKRAIEFKIDFAAAYNDLGWAYSELGQEEDAIAAYRQAVFLKPDYALTHHNLGWNLFKLGRYRESIDAYYRVLEMNPSYSKAASVYSEIAQCHAALKNYDEAKKIFEQALKTNSNDYMALNNYGYFLVVQNENIDKAIALLTQAETLNPTDYHLLDSLAWAYFKGGKIDEAEKYILKSIQQGGKSVEIYDHLGDIHQKRGHLDDAKIAWEKALSLASTNEQKTAINKKMGRE